MEWVGVKKVFLCKTALLLLCASVMVTTVQAQTIIGTVFDATTLERLPFCDAFFNNTSYRTETDSAGQFRFLAIPSGEYTLVVRLVGYRVYTQKVSVTAEKNNPLTINMVADRSLLAEVNVSAKKDKRWLRQLALFENQFLGNGEAARQCKIVNSWVLDFTENKGVLTARASDVLEIDNQYLGHKIRYALNNFTYNGTNIAFAGYAEFASYFTTDKAQKEQWQVNRQNAYWRSDIHLLKALKNRQAQAAGYEAFTDKPGEDISKRAPYFHQDQRKRLRPVVLDSLVTAGKEQRTYRLQVSDRLEIQHTTAQGDYPFYKDKAVDVAWLETNGQPLLFNADGLILNPADCVFSGYLANRRVSEMLPLDFLPNNPVKIVEQPRENESGQGVETPFFTTDRPWYFSRDVIQMSGVMQYADLRYADSLSSVLHVEVVNPENQKILIHQRIRIQNGCFSAQLALNDSVRVATHYLLRAYTQWMRNDTDSAYSYRWIAVLPPNQRMTGPAPADPAFADKFTLTQTDTVLLIKPVRTFAVQLRWGSVVLADAALVANPYPLSCQMPQRTVRSIRRENDFLIEKGITVRGCLKKPRLRSDGTATLVSTGQHRTFFTTVNQAGVFMFRNLPLTDNQTVLLAFTDAKSRRIAGATVTLDSLNSPAWLPILPRPFDNQYLEPDTTGLDWQQTGIGLSEVTVKAAKPPQPVSNLYKVPDYTVQGRDLFDKAVGMNILTALQGRVPGVTVVEVPDDQGFMKLVITMRGGNTVRGFQKGPLPQPLVLVDGIPFENVNQLAQIPASRVERIDIINRAESMLGLRGYVGVISITTKNGLIPDGLANSTDPTFISQTISGFAPDVVADKPKRTYFWQPHIGENTTISIPLPKADGTYRLVIEGLTTTNGAFRISELIKR